MTEPLSREQLIDMLLQARTITDCEMALSLAGRYLDRHPDDFDLASMTEQPAMILKGLQAASR